MSTNTDAIKSSTDAVVSSEPPINNNIAVSNGVTDVIGADSKTETLVDDSRVSGGEIGVVMDKDVKVGGDIVVQDEINDARVSVDEIGIVNVMDDKSEVVLDESISSVVVSSGPLSDSVGAVDGVKAGADAVGLETETLTVKPSDDCNGDGDIVVRDAVDGSRVSGDEKGIVMDESEVVLDKPIMDDVASSEPLNKRDVDAVDGVKIGADSLGLETETLTVKPSDGNSGDGDIVVQESVDDSKGSRDEKGVAMNDNEVVLDNSVSDDVASSEPQSNKDVDAVDGVKIGADSLGSKTETLTMKPSADHVQDSVDDSRASKDEQEIVTENIEKVSDENEVNNEEKEGEYKVTDIVWAKVKNYPWWPGQIFDPSAATDKAKKFSNKKGLLVGYFGDQSFAWNKPPNIKPFRKNFGKLEKQSNSKPFLHAVNCALDEVSRRVDFGLACSCLSKEVYDKVKSQVFVNAGIKEEASKIDGGDRFSAVSTFKPVKTVQSVQELAREHFDGVSRLEALSVRTQLLAFFRWKGRNQLKAPNIFDELDIKLEDESELPLTEENKVVEDEKLASLGKKVSSKKRKLDVSDSDSDSDDSPDTSDSDRDSDDSVPLKKERSLTKVTPKRNSSAKRIKQGISKKATIEDNVEPDSVGKKVSSKKRKADVCDSDGSYSVPRKKEKSSTKMTSKGSSSVKRSKNNTSKKTTLKDNVDKEENGSGTDNKRPSISSPRMFRVGDSICRIAKQLSESPSILKKESEKSKNDEKTAKKDAQPVDASQTEE
ncbi:putative non-specific serine/threonine protein kinase [Helianthus annuus]|nr:putative non-specific serine/threonine protein kinase [Helianthus annuus]KAJ0670927.1 putative non-specific serine/threonine protein kinase [Helianthus annuus]